MSYVPERPEEGTFFMLFTICTYIDQIVYKWIMDANQWFSTCQKVSNIEMNQTMSEDLGNPCSKRQRSLYYNSIPIYGFCKPFYI